MTSEYGETLTIGSSDLFLFMFGFICIISLSERSFEAFDVFSEFHACSFVSCYDGRIVPERRAEVTRENGRTEARSSGEKHTTGAGGGSTGFAEAEEGLSTAASRGGNYGAKDSWKTAGRSAGARTVQTGERA